jgi:hypothetical protein
MLEQVRIDLSKKFGIELIVTLDSREENCADEAHGEFLQCTPRIGFTSPFLQDVPPIVCIYEGGKVQFWNDGSPFPVKANTPTEALTMLRALVPSPVDADLVTRSDFNQFIDALKDIAETWDE